MQHTKQVAVNNKNKSALLPATNNKNKNGRRVIKTIINPEPFVISEYFTNNNKKQVIYLLITAGSTAPS
ncbi:MAG TPA: hypothetical protein VL020_04040 [Pseudomonadales bacterium]|nr:hypothetical protein [Pseudomonadales bacterium]